MDVILIITEKDFDRQTTPEKWPDYHIRPSARAVLFDSTSRIALIHVVNHHFYKLPGGGIDEGEDVETGLKRELLEEVGAESIKIGDVIGQVDEYRDAWGMKGEHYAFFAKLTGELVEKTETDKEIESGHEIIWPKNIDEAIALVKSSKPMEYGQDFEVARELAILEKAKEILDCNSIL